MGSIHEKIVSVGGGHGPTRFVRRIKEIRHNVTLVQTVFDHGGHSGTLRDELGIVGLGDLRRGMKALSEPESAQERFIDQILGFRLASPEVNKTSSLHNLSVGNLVLAMFLRQNGQEDEDLADTIERTARLAGMREGRQILPVSPEVSEIVIGLSDGTVLNHEGEVERKPLAGRRITEVKLFPSAHLHTKVHRALVEADKIVIGPTSFYSSAIANLLVTGFAETLKESRAKLIFVMNLMTDPYETEGFNSLDFARILFKYTKKKIDYMICNTGDIPHLPVAASRGLGGECPVEIVEKGMSRYVRHPLIKENLVAQVEEGIFRHSPRLASIIADM